MADTKESIGYGSQAYIDDGSASAYVIVDMLLEFENAAPKLGTVDSKRLDTPNATIVKVPTLFDGGECSLTQQFSQAGWTRLETLRKARAYKHVKFSVIDDTSTSVRIVPGLFTENKIDKVVADEITKFTTTFVVSGQETDSNS
jgi:hypothetical protein